MEINPQQLISAFLIGLLGGTHCVMMCGGIVSAISMQAKGQPPSLTRLLYYNFGRISSYTIAGIIFGSIGLIFVEAVNLKAVQIGLSIFAASLLILMGLFIAGWLNWIIKIEYLGKAIWKKLEPISRQWIPIKKDFHTYFIGLIWGWLPCGLVYSVLIWTLSSSSGVSGGLLMLAFGLGTLPNLIIMAFFATNIHTLLQKTKMKQISGMIIILFGLFQLQHSI